MPIIGSLRREFLVLGQMLSPSQYKKVHDADEEILDKLKTRGYIEGDTKRGYRFTDLGWVSYNLWKKKDPYGVRKKRHLDLEMRLRRQKQ